MSGDYPMGTTQATHDAAFAPTHDDSPERWNAIVREVESRAEEEVRTAHGTFVDWLADYAIPGELAIMIGFYKLGARTEVGAMVDDITRRYAQYRVATLDADEQREIEEEL